jgi:ATP adenylyltransferase/5',5'''-P-1,P-4-tetraphosphate phosphorylase II
LPEYCSLTGYADDGLLLIHANSRSSLELLANNTLRIVADWGVRNRLTFAPHKTYQLLLKGKLQVLPRVRFKGVTVAKRNSVCYLGLLLDKNFNFIHHMKRVGKKRK